MKRNLIIPFFTFILIGINAHAQAQVNDCLKKFSWLTGTWKMEENGSVMVEEWTAGGSGSIKCRSYGVKGNDTTLIERATISCIAGKQVFTYYPVINSPGQNMMPVTFALISEENGTYIFENPEHDFPQRVVYQMVNEKECHAWIAGDEKGKKSRIDFHYKKVLEPLQNH